MSNKPIESIWPEEHRSFTVVELLELSGLAERELMRLVECGTLVPHGEYATQWTFDVHCLTVARTARRLRDDFELDLQGLELALTLLNRIEELKAEIAELRARLPHVL